MRKINKKESEGMCFLRPQVIKMLLSSGLTPDQTILKLRKAGDTKTPDEPDKTVDYIYTHYFMSLEEKLRTRRKRRTKKEILESKKSSTIKEKSTI